MRTALYDISLFVAPLVKVYIRLLFSSSSISRQSTPTPTRITPPLQYFIKLIWELTTSRLFGVRKNKSYLNITAMKNLSLNLRSHSLTKNASPTDWCYSSIFPYSWKNLSLFLSKKLNEPLRQLHKTK